MEPRENPVNRAISERDVASLLSRYGVTAGCLDAAPYQVAFVHRSYRGRSASDAPRDVVPLQPCDYERLENLGDSVLHLAVTDYLHDRYPGESEAFVSQLRMKVVSGSVLSKLAFAAGLNRWTLLSAGAEAERARERPCVAEDVMEAFLAVLFRVHGYPVAREWFVNVLQEHLDLASLIFSLRCSKDRLVRQCSDRHGFRPAIRTVRGQDGDWVCTVTDADGAPLAEARCASAREAELAACQAAWDALVRHSSARPVRTAAAPLATS